jgi:hypothetical protein
MRKLALLLSGVVLLASVTPVMAFYQIVSDRFDERTGGGIAVVHVQDNVYALVRYVDTDGDGKYTPGDVRVRTILFRQGATKSTR